MFDVAVEEARKQLDAGATDTVPETTANLMCNELFALVRDNESQKTAEEIVGEGEGMIDREPRYNCWFTADELGSLACTVLAVCLSSRGSNVTCATRRRCWIHA